MKIDCPLPHLDGFKLVAIHFSDENIILQLRPKRKSAVCPLCHHRSSALHSSYIRTLADLPLGGKALSLSVEVRRFRCYQAACSRKIFCERLPQLTRPHARTTLPMSEALQQIGVALGGNPGAILARQLGIPTSPSTLLRRVKALPDTQETSVRVLGVDDWALRKGQRYATVLCDLQKRRPLELLPDRTAETLIVWLNKHPEIEIISRDRGGPYAAAANQAAPQAQQVADRFHLLKNLGEALKRLLDRHIVDLNAVAANHTEILPPAPLPAPLPAVEMQKPDPPRIEAPEDEHKCEPTTPSRELRLSHYAQVRDLAQQGLSERSIARQCVMSRDTVRKYLHADAFPERATGLRPPKADRFAPLIVARLQEGGHTIKAIFEELRTLGYTGAYSRLSVYARQIYPASTRAATVLPLRSRLRLSAWSATWLFLRKSEKLSEADRRMAAELCERSAEIARANVVVQSFARLIRERHSECLDVWLEEASNCGVAEMVNFARGIRQDYSAVKAALSLPWSNGLVEGQINRLKLIKRSMYGRAGLPLLRKRYLPAR